MQQWIMVTFGGGLLRELKTPFSTVTVQKKKPSLFIQLFKMFYSNFNVVSFKVFLFFFHLIIHEQLSNYLLLPIGGSTEIYQR